MRLTMGGEPTFVSIDDMEGAEWMTAAVGPTKRAFADTLIRRLRERFAPGGLLHFGQGKWYPGESLPRWAFSLYWRGDGLPLWREADRIATERRNYAPSAEDARELAHGIARRLDLNPDYAMPAYEDTWHYLAREQALPVNVDPFDSKLEDAEERARLARVFERGLKTPVGFVLPVQRWNSADRRRWRSERWPTRSGQLDADAGRFARRAASAAWKCCRGCRRRSAISYSRKIPFGALPPLPSADSYRQPYLSGASRDAAWQARQRAVEQMPPDRRRERAHRADGRTARWAALRVHAADRNGHRLSRSAVQHRRCRGRARCGAFTSKAIRRPTIRDSISSR